MAQVGMSTDRAQLVMTRYEKRIIDATRRHEGQFNKISVKPANTTRIEGRIKTAEVTSLGNTIEGANFRTPNAPETVPWYTGQKIFDASVQITDAALGIINGSDVNFAAAAQYLISSAVEASLRYREGMHYLDGTGVVGVLTGTVTAGTTAMSVTGYDSTSGRTNDRTSVNAMIWNNGRYDIYNASTLAYVGTVGVANQNDPTSSGTLGNFTLKAPGFPAGVSTGMLLVWAGSFGLAYEGLNSLIDNDVSTSYQGVDFVTYPSAKVWQSTVLANGGTPRALTPSLFIQAQKARAIKMAGSPSPKGDGEWVANFVHGESFYNMFNVAGVTANAQAVAGTAYPANNRITPDASEVGNGAITFVSPYGKVKLQMKYHCPEATIYNVDYSQLNFYQSKALGWRPGQENLFTPSQTSAVRTAQMYEIGQVAVEDRRHMSKITDLSFSTVNSGT